jgi:large conductance mechanosensitive channel
MKGFREFLARGNVVDLAVAVVIGTAFAAVVKALVDNVINPIIAIPAGKPNFNSLSVTVNGSEITYGTFVTALITFVLVAAAVYFALVLPYTKFRERRAGPTAAVTRPCPECLSEIPLAAKRCSYCTSPVEPQAAA